MRLVCPGCGAVMSAEVTQQDGDARHALVCISRLPGELPGITLRYLALFRKPSSPRGLSWGRVRRLAAELHDMVQLGGNGGLTWKDGSPRRTTPAMWAEGVNEMLDRAESGKIQLPLDSHGYLRSVVYGIADKADAQAEQERYQVHHARRGGSTQHETESGQPLSVAENKQRASELLKRLREKQDESL